MKTLAIIAGYCLYKAVKRIATAVKAAPKRIAPEPAFHAPLMIEQYSRSTIAAYRNTTRNEWVAMKNSLQLLSRKGYGLIKADTSTFSGETESRAHPWATADYHDPDDGVIGEAGVLIYPQWWESGNHKFPRCGYRGFTPISKSIRHLFREGYIRGSELWADELFRSGKEPGHSPIPSAHSISRGIDAVIASCPSAAWEIDQMSPEEKVEVLNKLDQIMKSGN